MVDQDAVLSEARSVDLIGIAHRLAARELIHILHTRRDFAPDGILPVEKPRIVESNEELRICAVWAR